MKNGCENFIKTTKYKNKRTIYDGMVFDSIKEKNRYIELQLMEKSGAIEGLKRQVDFILIDKSKYGQCIKYKADFTYIENDKLIVEDVKSKATKTRVYLLKKRLLAERYGIIIKET